MYIFLEIKHLQFITIQWNEIQHNFGFGKNTNYSFSIFVYILISYFNAKNYSIHNDFVRFLVGAYQTHRSIHKPQHEKSRYWRRSRDLVLYALLGDFSLRVKSIW